MSYNPLNPNGQAAMANSSPVVIASDQSAVPVSGTMTANLGTLNGAATAAKQDTGNTSIASIDTKTPALGQALAAASVPVVLTADQVSTLTPPAAIAGFATSAKQDTIIGHIDGIEAALTTIAGHVDQLEGYVDTLESLLSTSNTNTGNAATSLGIMDDWDNGASDGASVSGDVAHDTADAGEPVKIGGKAVNAEPAAVAANDRVNALFDLVGKLIVLPYANPENFVSGAITSAMTGTTSTSLVAAPGSGLRNYITTIIVSNAHATVGTDVIIQDGSGGTTLLTIPAAALYGGATITLPTPLRQPTTNTALFCANVTTGASTKVSALGYKGV